jgi:hypothetical protein
MARSEIWHFKGVMGVAEALRVMAAFRLLSCLSANRQSDTAQGFFSDD